MVDLKDGRYTVKVVGGALSGAPKVLNAILKHVREIITLEDLKQDSANRVYAAKQAMGRCTPVEQEQIFRDLGRCGCAIIAGAAAGNPPVVVGALLGGIAGAILDHMTKKNSS